MYDIELKVNNEVFKATSDNLKEAIQGMKPEFVHTEGYMKISKGEAVFERMLNLVSMRKLFADEQQLEIFINNIMF